MKKTKTKALEQKPVSVFEQLALAERTKQEADAALTFRDAHGKLFGKAKMTYTDLAPNELRLVLILCADLDYYRDRAVSFETIERLYFWMKTLKDGGA